MMETKSDRDVELVETVEHGKDSNSEEQPVKNKASCCIFSILLVEHIG
jgi:hypothetical protein